MRTTMKKSLLDGAERKSSGNRSNMLALAVHQCGEYFLPFITTSSSGMKTNLETIMTLTPSAWT